MPIELKIPAVGESITEVEIAQWLKSEGDTVAQDEPLAVIDSQKSTFELPAPQGGRLSKILHQAGETVPVGAIVAMLEPSDSAAKPQPNGTAAKSETAKVEVKAETAKPGKTDKQKPAEPEKPKAAEAPKASVPAVKAEAAAPKISSSAREEEVVPMTLLRRTVAQRLLEAQQTMAMLTTFNEVDMSAVQALRHEYQEAFEKRYQVKLGLMSFFIKAAIDALKQFPQLNAEVRGNDIIYRNYFDMGVAVSTERGLVVPVVRNAERLTFAELEKTIGDFGKRAKEGKVKPDELSGGTFTITNGGVFGSLLSTPIINPPQTGILGLHSIQERPVAVQGQVVIRPIMYLALTYDHRIVDGREAVMFLKRIKQAIEAPARMLVEI